MSKVKVDVESKTHHLSGFPSLAHFIASDRDRTTMIYKRYDDLAARNLLYLQSELAELQAKQHAFDQADLKADLGTKQCARNFGDFQKAVQTNVAKQKERWELVKQIRETLKEYREALLFESTLATLPRPSKKVLKAFRTEFNNEGNGTDSAFPTLGGNSRELYNDIDDLVALRVQDDQDRMTTFAQEYLAFLFPVSVPPFKNESEAAWKWWRGHKRQIRSSYLHLREKKQRDMKMFVFSEFYITPQSTLKVFTVFLNNILGE